MEYEPLLNREETLYMYSYTYMYYTTRHRKIGDWDLDSKYSCFGVYSMNETGIGRNFLYSN